MKPSRDLGGDADLSVLLASSSLGKGAAGPGPTRLSDAPVGRRLFVRLVMLGVLLVVVWAFVDRTMLAPLAERVRVHTATTRVASHKDSIQAACEQLDMDPNLIAAIVFAESSGRVDARSKADALGLMQLKVATAEDRARDLGLPLPTETDLLTDPALNILLGTAHIQWAIKHEDGHLERALVGYNAGRGKLRRWIKEAGGYDEWRAGRVEAGNSSTLAYATKVLAQRDAFAKAGLFGASARAEPTPQAPALPNSEPAPTPE
ncbi:MAG: lytic transglycosylase domain-containing protein [Planctomycetota bacterium]|nr:lytic transglycosylase domain-containing protein [Planctomycetota bacterium]